MVFSSLEFIFIFLPAFMLVYGLARKELKNAVIFLGSLIFYSVGVIKHPIYILLFFLTILFNFIIGEFIGHFRKSA
ncbi:MAG TPA: membrane-bound O-acyltransferase family protein, partial [Ruminococcus sp.]|nr:membrane-bound O-acyltransferase family protein [Ruminococcus sp.]